MQKTENGIVMDERGLFVFGPWWFVILVMIIGFIFSISKNNKVKNKGAVHVNDYEPVNKPINNLSANNICPHCGKNNSKNAKFCRGCGDNLVDYPGIYCPECGESNSKKAKFCIECEKKLDNIEAVKLMGVGLNLYFFELRFPRLAF
jgi:ribosomal protein L40E